MHVRIKLLSLPDFLRDGVDPGVPVQVLEIKFQGGPAAGTGESIMMDSSPLVLGDVSEVPEM